MEEVDFVVDYCQWMWVMGVWCGKRYTIVQGIESGKM